MAEKQDDMKKTIEEMVRQLMAAANDGRIQPVFVGMKVIVSPGGGGPLPPQKARGDSVDPGIEIHRVGKRVMLVTEMPGVSSENVRVLFRDDRVYIWAREGEIHYKSSARVPHPLKGSEEMTFRHGVLEVTYLPEEDGDQGETTTP
ncbi:MAG: hypothetical protein NQU46_07405 [Methanolinea sp.]|nr:hypothetical protein [Methanolinea sp.]